MFNGKDHKQGDALRKNDHKQDEDETVISHWDTSKKQDDPNGALQ